MILIAAVAAVLAFAAPSGEQRRPAGSPSQQATVPAQISLKAGAQSYDFSGQAKCQHAPQASIYGAAAELWKVEHSGDGRNLTLTVWRPRSGGESMMNLSVSAGGQSYSVNTVKVGQQGSPSGSGTVSFAAAGKGGTFTIDAAAKGGVKIAGTIACEAFTPLIAEGGD